MVEGMAKLCGICGEDCAARPRVKDVDGNYFCKTCLNDRQQGKGPAAAAGVKTSAATASAFLDASPSASDALWAGVATVGGQQPAAGQQNGPQIIPCPQCGTKLKPDSVLCTSCGYSLKRGKRLNTKITKEKELSETAQAAASGATWGLQMLFAAIGGVIGGALAGVLWVGVALVGFYILWLGILIGAAAGKGAAYGAGDRRGLVSGCIGLAAAAVTFLAAQYTAYSIHIEAARTLAMSMISINDEDLTVSVYDEVFNQYREEGRLSQNEMYDDEEYPKIVVREGDRRLNNMSDQEKSSRKSEMLAQRKQSVNWEIDKFKSESFWTLGMESESSKPRNIFRSRSWLAASGLFIWVCLGLASVVGFVTGTGGEFS